MSGNLWRSISTWFKNDKDRSIKIILCGLVLLGGICLLVMDYRDSRIKPIKEIERNTYGKGSQKSKIDVYSEEEGRKQIEIEISERIYTQEELESFFHRVTKKLDQLILGENESVDCINKDMNLVTNISNIPVQISWELSRYDVMGIDGKIKNDNIDRQGCLVELKGIMTYTQQPEKHAIYETSVLIFPKGSEDDNSMISAISEEIKKYG